MPFPPALTSSLITSYKACPRKFKHSYIDRLVPEGKSIHLTAGAAFAAGLCAARRAFYENGKSEEDALVEGIEEILKTWDIDEFVHHNKNIATICNALDFYLSRNPLSADILKPIAYSDNKKGIEFNFSVDIPNIRHPDTGDPLLYEGRFDMLSSYSTMTVAVDEKTTSQLGERWGNNFSLRFQFMGYIWAPKRLGYDINAVFVRQIAIRKTGFDLAELPIIFPDYLIDRWYEHSLIPTIHSMIRSYENDDWPYNFADACTSYGGCPMHDLCWSANPQNVSGFQKAEKLYFE